MFKSLTIAKSEFDVGSVGEALLYYGRVNLVVRAGTLSGLVKSVGFETLIRALEMGVIKRRSCEPGIPCAWRGEKAEAQATAHREDEKPNQYNPPIHGQSPPGVATGIRVFSASRLMAALSRRPLVGVIIR
jgi:hypothetical protein